MCYTNKNVDAIPFKTIDLGLMIEMRELDCSQGNPLQILFRDMKSSQFYLLESTLMNVAYPNGLACFTVLDFSRTDLMVHCSLNDQMP